MLNLLLSDTCCMLSRALQAFLERCTADLMDLTDLVQGQLSEAEHLTLGALITMDVHARDVVQELVDAGAHTCMCCHLPCCMV